MSLSVSSRLIKPAKIQNRADGVWVGDALCDAKESMLSTLPPFPSSLIWPTSHNHGQYITPNPKPVLLNETSCTLPTLNCWRRWTPRYSTYLPRVRLPGGGRRGEDFDIKSLFNFPAWIQSDCWNVTGFFFFFFFVSNLSLFLWVRSIWWTGIMMNYPEYQWRHFDIEVVFMKQGWNKGVLYIWEAGQSR